MRDLQRQDYQWLSAAFICVLDCPLADAAVTALTFHQKGKPLPTTEYPRKMLRCLTSLSYSPCHLCNVHCLGFTSITSAANGEDPGRMHTIWNSQRFIASSKSLKTCQKNELLNRTTGHIIVFRALQKCTLLSVGQVLAVYVSKTTH